MNMHWTYYLADSCFPNCHPVGSGPSFNVGGDMPLVGAVICIILILLLKGKGK